MEVIITYPESWVDIKLEKYLQYYKQIKPYQETEDYTKKLIELGAYYFCDIDPTVLYSLPATTLDKVNSRLVKLMESSELPLVKTFMIGETEYGFVPNIEEISYGEYLDLVEYFKDMWTFMPIIMSILYRPVVKKFGDSYTIESYNGTNDARIELFKHALTMDVVFGATAFFLSLQRDLLNATLTFSIKKLKTMRDPRVTAVLEDLQKNGDPIKQLQSLLAMTSPSSIK